MDKIKVRAHTCYLGKTGYNAHSRGFFRALSKFVDLRVRNYTWDDNPDYLNEVDLSILDTITLSTGDDKYADFPIRENNAFRKFKFTTPKTPFKPDVDIVLMDMNHHYFYEKFDSKIKIAYTVWESTRLPGYFVERLIENFDYVWVVTEWHKKVLSEQGYPESRIHVVNEAVDADFFPGEFDPKFSEYQDGRFKFSIFGRWDFRKSIPEIIDAFLKEFKKDEPVDLIMSVDNPYAVDGMFSTEERLHHYGFVDERLKVKHFVKRDEYIKYIKNGHVMITCARAEGWNIPLIEAIAAGTPALYTDYGAQLEFAADTGVPVDIKGMVPCLSGDTYNVQALAGTEVPGYYAQPDYEDLRRKMRYAYENYKELKEKALIDSERIRETFTWENAALQAVWFFAEKALSHTKEKNGRCAVILSHANTKVKKMRMNDLVNKLNRSGFTTVLSTHLNEESQADYTIIDSHNDVVDQKKAEEIGTVLPDFFFTDDNIDINVPFDYNHGTAVLSLVKNALDFAIGRGYEKIHFVNYDYYIKNVNVLDDHLFALEKGDYVGYSWGADDEINTGFFSCDVKVLKDLLSKVKTYKDYFDVGIHFEQFMHNLLKQNGIKTVNLGKIDESKVIVNGEVLPTYPLFNLGKDNLHYSLTKEKNTGKLILSILGNTPYSIEVRLKYGKKIKKMYVAWDIVHFEVSKDIVENGLEIYLPSFEMSAFVNSSTKIGTSDVKNWESVKQLNIDEFESASSLTRRISINYIDGPYVEIKDSQPGDYLVEFIDQKEDKIIYSSRIQNNCWTRAGRKWFTDWKIRITDVIENQVIHEEKIDLRNKRVFICFESSALGDSLGWIGYVDEFRKKHGCRVIVSTFHNDLFKGQYPELEFVGRGVSVPNIIAMYRIGWFYDGNSKEHDESKNPVNFRDQEMQKSAADILGLEFQQVRPKIHIPQKARTIQGKYVCIGIHSTAQAKYWNNPDGWQEVVDYLKDNGYKVVLITKESGTYMGNKPPKGIIDKSGNQPLSDRINDLYHADFYIGLGSGLSWLAWAVGTPTVLISGFSKPETEFVGDDVVRLFNSSSCNSCFNRFRLDAGDWNWCPDHKGTERMFECTKSITPEMVIRGMKKFMK